MILHRMNPTGQQGRPLNTLATALGSSQNLLQQLLGQVRHSYVDHGEELSQPHLPAPHNRNFGVGNEQYRSTSREEDRSRNKTYNIYDYERDRDRDRTKNSWAESGNYDYDRERDYDRGRDRSYRSDRREFPEYETSYRRSDYEDDRQDRMSSHYWDLGERHEESERREANGRSSFFGGLLDKRNGESREHPRGRSKEPYWDDRRQGDRSYSKDWEKSSSPSLPPVSYGIVDPMQIPTNALVRPHCYLEPPPAAMHKLPQRQKPEGCRTAFIGGLPEAVDEVIINEIFFVCGPIESIKINKAKRGEQGKKYCHIRFISQESVDQAVLFAGHNLVIGDGKEKSKVGRFHVDYATSKEDEREHEALERAKAREFRQRALEQEINSPGMTKTVFSDHEATVLLEKIRREKNIFDCLQVLVQWLEKGECNRKTASTFYSLLSSTHSNVKRLIKEKGEHEELVKRQKQEQLEKAHRIKDQCK